LIKEAQTAAPAAQGKAFNFYLGKGKKMKTKNKGRVLIAALLFLIVFSLPTQPLATDYNWVGTSGNWSDPANWSPSGPPIHNSDNVYLTQSGASDINISYDASTMINSLQIFGGGQGSVIFSISGNDSLAVYQGSIMVGESGKGIINQTGGRFDANTDETPIVIGNGGIYNMSGGLIGMNIDVHVNSGGIFNQTGGFNGYDGVLKVNTGGTYNLSGNGSVGPATGQGEWITGTFNQYGGYNTAGSAFFWLDGGTYNLIDGNLTLDAWSNTIKNGGTFNQSGGTSTITLTAIDPFKIGNTVGDGSTYNLSGGNLNANNIINNGTLNFSGGNVSLLHQTTTWDPINQSYIWEKGTLTNNGSTSLSGAGTRTIDGNIVNNGTFKVTNTTAVYTGSFLNNGTYLSDPATSKFLGSLTVGSDGIIIAGAGDIFEFYKDFINNSSRNTEWQTSLADLFFSTGSHTFFIGQTGNNLYWDDLTLDLGAILDLEGGGELHINNLHVYDLAQLTGLGLISYDHLDIIGSTSVPEPTTMLLLGLGLIGLAGIRRKFRN